MIKRRANEEHENHDRWLVSYADFITLLFAFFTILYATSNQDVEKAKKFEDSVKKAFLAVAQFGKASGPGDYAQYDENASPIPPPIELFKRSHIPTSELMEAIERLSDESLTKEEKQSVQFDLREDAFGVRLSLDSSALFDSGSTTMKRESLPIFNKVAEILKKTNKNLIIEGHTDNQPIHSGAYPSNWELAGARASTVVRYLIKVHGIPPSHLVAVSLADQRPVISNDTEKGRRKNRRIEILLATKNTSLD